VELFNVELSGEARPKVQANSENRWLTEAEIQTGQTGNGQPVSPTMKQLLEEATREA
jgi:hypothetical protein